MYRPLRSLREGCWFKLICGASFQHLPAVRSLTLAYALAGADCIDVAADPAVIATAHDALTAAASLIDEAQVRGYRAAGLPWLMVSLNDGEDPHFRKAEFDITQCPPGCPRPCELICPTNAIGFEHGGSSGVIEALCYGCGRCLSVCPIQNIAARSYVFTPSAVAPLVLSGVDAVEIHTQIGRLEHFGRLWQAIVPDLNQLKLVSISCPDGEGLVEYLWALHELMSPLPCALVWQTDGRPMSGDIGDGATRAAVKLGQKVLAAGLPGYVQLAGGTNRHTVSKLKSMRLLKAVEPFSGLHEIHLKRPYIAGIAYGSYARSILAPILEVLEPPTDSASLSQSSSPLPTMTTSLISSVTQSIAQSATQPIIQRAAGLEHNSDLLWQAVNSAYTLVSDIKGMNQSDPQAAFQREQA